LLRYVVKDRPPGKALDSGMGKGERAERYLSRATRLGSHRL
jgi:hypothetical protein